MSDAVPLVLLTRCEEVRASVCRLAATIGRSVQVAGDDAAAHWRTARPVVVDADLCQSSGLTALPPRPGVFVVSSGAPAEAVWQWALRIGACAVLRLPADEGRLIEHLAAGRAAVTARVLAVVGGCGGAGASTLAAALALTASGCRPTVLVDGDAGGGGLDVLLGAESAAGARWPDLAAARGSLPAAGLLATLVTVGALPLLSWGRSPGAVPDEAIGAVLDAVSRGCDLVVADLPRHRAPGFESLRALADLTVVVAPATVRGVAAATAAVAGLPAGGERCVVVRDPGGGLALSADDVGGHLGLPVAAVVASEPAVRDAALRGEPPLRRDRGSLHDACRALLRRCEPRSMAA